MEEKKIAVILVRGLQGANKEVVDSLKMLNIQRRNTCAVLKGSKSMLGMVNKLRKYVTYGEVSEEVIKLLKEKKGVKKHYNLNSPKKGYGRKGIKYDFSHSGALGYRGEKINDLIKRMI